MRQGTSRALWLALPVVASAVLGACGRPDAEESTVSQFFANSVRRDPTEAETRHVANLGGCTAYFIENTAGKTYVGTARHCVNSNITGWCANGGAIRRTDGSTYRCQRVVAANTELDLNVFEATGPQTVAPEDTLRLAAYAPAVGTRLRMIGYPADQYRRGALTVTENCWVLKQDVPSPHGQWRDRSSLHNCSTYGGNSGGPMIREGSRDVMGLPFTYQPNDYHLRDAEDLRTAAHMAQMANFVATFRATLAQNGVVISDAP